VTIDPIRGASDLELSVLVPVRGRGDHLASLVDGLGRAQSAPPFELIVGWMGGTDPRPALARARGFEARAISVEGDELPLAGARNALAEAAAAPLLVFLDVDCVPSAGLLSTYMAVLRDRGLDALAIGETRYLPRGLRADGAPESTLRRAAKPHADRVALFPAPDSIRVDSRHDLFWSLNFALRRSTFRERIGGFDPAFRGYGIEDTDFAMRAAASAVPLAWVGGALAFHQWHPPTRLRPEGVPALVENVRRYRERWGDWPAKGWLAELAAAGLVDWDEEAGTLAPRSASATR
jgi:N-acetylglucosaminyl-diphospho-decaprenol L-rhamnosyltransferase